MRKLTYLLTILLFSAPAWAATPEAGVDTNDHGVIHACAKVQNGQLRVVEDASECLPSERYLSWGGEGEAPPPPVIKPCCKDRYQFVGFSEKGVHGGAGLLKFTQMCQETFPKSRICDSKEVATTTSLPEVVAGDVLTPAPFGWVRPTEIGSTFDTIVGMQANPEDLACAGWMQSGSGGPLGADTGLSVNRYGQFALSVCVSLQQKVACCAIVEEEESVEVKKK